MISNIDKKYFKLAVGESRIKHETPVDIAVRCPICGDSKYSKNKARLHLYEKNGETRVNCFNECRVHNRTVYGFLRDFYPALLENYRKETFGNNLKSLTLDSIEFEMPDFEDHNESSESSESRIEVQKPNVLFDLKGILGNTEKAHEYVKSRGLRWDSEQLGEIYIARDNITIDGKHFPIRGYIVIPFYCGSKMYGFYSRSLTEHKFFTYMPSANTDWKMWNFFNLDSNKTVYVFEGIFDALSAYNSGITNIIACCGAVPPLERLDGYDVVMCLDNDQTGKKNSLKYLEKGYKVLYYGDIREKDMNDFLKSGGDVKKLIMNNVVSGIMGIVKIKSSL